MSDQVRWFDWFGSCSDCLNPAMGTLRGPGNQIYGTYCGKCADRRLRKDEKERAALAKAKGEA